MDARMCVVCSSKNGEPSSDNPKEEQWYWQKINGDEAIGPCCSTHCLAQKVGFTVSVITLVFGDVQHADFLRYLLREGKIVAGNKA